MLIVRSGRFNMSVLLTSLLWVMAVGEQIHFPNSPPDCGQSVPMAGSPIESSLNNSAQELDISTRLAGFEAGIKFSSAETTINEWQDHVDKILSRGVLQLSLGMDDQIAAELRKEYREGENIVLSPLSVASALALVMLGANGKTFTELAHVLGLGSNVNLADRGELVHKEFGRLLMDLERSRSIHINVATAVFLQQGYPIKNRYARMSHDIYKSQVINLDFLRRPAEAQSSVNRWVDENTQGRIKELLSSPPTQDTRVLIASALYFNGEWQKPFPVENTAMRPFFIGNVDNSKIDTVELLTMVTGGQLPYVAHDGLGCKMVGFPYKGGEATLYAVLPNEPGLGVLRSLQKHLTAATLESLVTSSAERAVIVTFPRMHLTATTHLQTVLKSLGVTALFNPYESDLSAISSGDTSRKRGDNQYLLFSPRMGNETDDVEENDTLTNDDWNTTTDTNDDWNTTTDSNDRKVRQVNLEFDEDNNVNPGLYATDVVHKVEIEITETGTVATAATGISITRSGSHPLVRFNRPFMFFIRHNPTGLVLFWGSVVKPTPSRPWPSTTGGRKV